MSADPSNAEARKTPTAMVLLAALLAAIAGFVAIYVSFGGHGNVVPSATVTRVAPPAADTAAKPAPAGEGIAGLNRGHMATFVVHEAPKELPAFSFTADQGDVSLSQWRGKVVLLNLWATWCAPCRKEMPWLDDLKAELGGDSFDVVAISIDRGGPDKPRHFLQKIGVKHLKLYQDNTGRLAPKLKAFGMPTTLLIDRSGREIGRLVGPAEWNSEDALILLRRAIAATS